MTFKLPFYPNPASTSGAAGSGERGSRVVRAPKQDPSGHHSPVEIHPLLRELSVAVVRVLKGLVLDDFYPFPSVTLLMAVLADHVQLSDFVLQNTETEVSPMRPSKTLPRPHQTANSTFCSRKRADTWPGVPSPGERGEQVVSRRQKRHVPVNISHHAGNHLGVGSPPRRGEQQGGAGVGISLPIGPCRVKWS